MREKNHITKDDIKRFIKGNGCNVSGKETPDEHDGFTNICMIAAFIWILHSLIKDITFYFNSSLFDFISELLAYTVIGIPLSLWLIGVIGGYILSIIYFALFRTDTIISKFICFLGRFNHKFIIALAAIIFLTVYAPLSYSEFKSATEPEVSYTESEEAETMSETTEEQNKDEDFDVWQVDTDKTPLTIREKPSKDSKKIGSLSKGAIAWVTTYDETGKWGYAANTETNNENDFTPGWINLEYCTDCIAMGGGWVYLLKGEPYYHTKNCKELKGYSNETIKACPRDDAPEDGYEPCPKCGGF